MLYAVEFDLYNTLEMTKLSGWKEDQEIPILGIQAKLDPYIRNIGKIQKNYRDGKEMSDSCIRTRGGLGQREYLDPIDVSIQFVILQNVLCILPAILYFTLQYNIVCVVLYWILALLYEMLLLERPEERGPGISYNHLGIYNYLKWKV